MNFKYRLTKNDYQKILMEKRKSNTLIYVFILSLLFLIVNCGLVLNNIYLIIMAYLLYVILLVLLLFVFNRLIIKAMVKLNEKKLNIKYGTYTLKIEKTKLVNTIDSLKYELKYDDIKKMKYYKDLIIIYPKSGASALIFKKDLFEGNSDFDKLKQKLEEKVKISK